MTTSMIDSTPMSDTPRELGSTLRTALRLNALNCVVSGGALAVAAGPTDRLLDTGYPGWVRLVGLGLLPFAAMCWWLAGQPTAMLRRLTPWVVAGDVGWVVASVVTVLLGWYSGGGVIAVLVMAALVDTFAVLQFIGWRKLRTFS